MKSLREKTVFTNDKRRVSVIESLEFQTIGTNRSQHATASLVPVAVVVKEPDRTYALDMNAQPLDIDRMELPAGFERK